VRNNTINRFGPVREVTHEPHAGWSRGGVRGIASVDAPPPGVAMRFPRISRIRWDKPPAEADRIEALTKPAPAPAAAGGRLELPESGKEASEDEAGAEILAMRRSGAAPRLAPPAPCASATVAPSDLPA